MTTLAFRFTVFSLVMAAFAAGFAASVVHDNHAPAFYSSNIIFR